MYRIKLFIDNNWVNSTDAHERLDFGSTYKYTIKYLLHLVLGMAL